MKRLRVASLRNERKMMADRVPLSQLKKTRRRYPPRILFYSVVKFGKTRFANCCPGMAFDNQEDIGDYDAIRLNEDHTVAGYADALGKRRATDVRGPWV